MQDIKLLEYNRDLDRAIKENRWIDLSRRQRILDLFAVKNGYTLKDRDTWQRKRVKIHRKLRKFLTGKVVASNWNKLTIQIGSKKHKKKIIKPIKDRKSEILNKWRRDLAEYRERKAKETKTVLRVLRRL